ncbi:MAG: cyclodeaminase/cyclohydrolase family protein [Bacillales bacterium]|jgi:formiminotetrahydrofolate cyclodeaminase|nr:cyclodeaminase/cyclohydrolase family protein [Bacillales bacterium]
MIEDLKIEEFLDELSSTTPAPSGGTVVGLLAGIATALSVFVCNLTVNKERYLESKPKITSIIKKLNKFQIAFIELANRDEYVLFKLSKIWALPKSSEEEKKDRQVLLDEFNALALQVPYQIILHCEELYGDLEFLAVYGNDNLKSDVLIAAYLFKAVVYSSTVNVRVNFSALKSTSEREAYAKQITKQKKRVDEFVSNIQILTKF